MTRQAVSTAVLVIVMLIAIKYILTKTGNDAYAAYL